MWRGSGSLTRVPLFDRDVWGAGGLDHHGHLMSTHNLVVASRTKKPPGSQSYALRNALRSRCMTYDHSDALLASQDKLIHNTKRCARSLVIYRGLVFYRGSKLKDQNFSGDLFFGWKLIPKVCAFRVRSFDVIFVQLYVHVYLYTFWFRPHAYMMGLVDNRQCQSTRIRGKKMGWSEHFLDRAWLNFGDILGVLLDRRASLFVRSCSVFT